MNTPYGKPYACGKLNLLVFFYTQFTGQSSESQTRRLPPMEQFLYDVAAAVVAGVIVALIAKGLDL